MELKASYTIEAAILFPFILILVIGTIRVATRLYEEEAAYMEQAKEISQIHPVQTLRQGECIKKVLEMIE